MTQRAIVFDLDGTLIDSESLAFVAWERALKQFNRVFKHEDELLVLGIDLSGALANVKRHFRLTESIETIYRVLGREWTVLTAQGLPTMPGVHILLDTLDQRRIQWGVATNSDLSYAFQHLSHVGLAARAKAIVGQDMVANPKPSPDVFAECARLMGVEPANCIAVEDSKVGHRAAKAAGMTVVVVLEGATSAEFPHADLILPNLHAFQAQLDQILIL